MSHFTTIETRINDIDSLRSALTSLKFRYEEGECTVRDYAGKTQEVDLAIRTGTDYDIGFRRKADVYEIVADWWGLQNYAGLQEKQTVDKIRQRYAYEKIMKEQQKLKLKGFMLAKHEVTEENVEVITLRRF